MKKVRDAGFSWKRSGNAGSGSPLPDPDYGKQVEGQGNRSVNIGFMELEASGNLKRCRGKTLQVKV